MAGRQAGTIHPVTSPDSASRRVRVLPMEVANRIAAGEVVERPASVVKELVENALDAGARRIEVELEQAGSALIAVVDDGEGMGPEDAVCAFSRHATSKISAFEDLERIGTMGFRGEALASIAAVSRVTLVTRRADDLAGTRVELDGGRIVDVREAGAPAGTRVEVADLFVRTPARRKFLKTAATEVGHVSELITRLALAWPHVGFAVRHGRRTLVELAAAEDPFERVRQVVGGERAQAMLPFLGRSASGAVHGWVASPHLTFPSARQIYTYVNHRHIRDKLVSHALVAGYSTLLMHGRYPAAVLFLEVPAEEVDVNVHPAKSEVRFRRGGAVHDLISRAVQSRLREEGRNRTAVTPTPRLGSRGPASQIPAEARGRDMPASLRLIEQPRGGPMWSTPPLPAPAATIPSVDPPMPRDAGSSRPGDAASFADLRVIGQLFDGYLLCEQSDALLLIDQHAAHERVMFENLRVAYGSGLMPRQRLLVPEMVEVGPREAALLGERVEDLALLGFEIECFGGNSFHIRAVPALLGDCDPRLLLQDLADELVEVGRSRRLSEAAESVLARLACHSAVRVGQSLGGEQIRALLQAMDRIDLSGSCPHGRPAFIRLPRSDIERWFKRT